MKKTLFFTFIFLIITALPHTHAAVETPSEDNPDQAIFASTGFGFTMTIPREWHKTEFDLGYKHILILKGKNRARIKITAVVNDAQENMKWDQWEEWHNCGSGRKVTTIIEKKDINYGQNMQGTLIVFESAGKKNTYLQRMLLVRSSDSIIIIECSAPVSAFYRHAALFDAVMSSLTFTEKTKGAQ